MASGLTAYDVPPAPLVPAVSGSVHTGETYWDLVLRQFRRNRLAAVSFYFILLLFLIAIAAPFLADNRPIVFHGTYRSAYRDTYDEWRLGGHPELVAAMEAAQRTKAVATAPQLATVDRQLRKLASQLPGDSAKGLLAYIPLYRSAVESSQPALLAKYLDEIASRFDPGKVKLEAKLYFPVFAALRPLDVFFVTLAGLLLLLLVLRPFLPKTWARSWRVQLLIVTLPSVMLALLWSGRPEVFDTYNYKQQLFNGEIEESLALFPPIQYGINEDHLEEKYQGPSARHWIGTDGNGRDLLTRMIWGSRISLSVGFVAVAIYVTIGILVGTLAGYFRGWVDLTLSRAIEIMICFPAFFLILAVLAFLQPSMWNIMVVIGVTGWTTEARLVRGEFLRLANQEFVLAAKGLGVSVWRIIFRHILPNGLAPLLVSASFGIASAILIESSLSFLGFGISIPVPSWGGILNEARESFRYWWITIFPGLAIFSTVTAYNLVGEGMRDAMDPRLKA
jgi:peptide/nickel transport system permease protein